MGRAESSAASQCRSIPFLRQSSAFRSRERPKTKTGFCSCLHQGAGDSDANGLRGHPGSPENSFVNNEIALDASGKSGVYGHHRKKYRKPARRHPRRAFCLPFPLRTAAARHDASSPAPCLRVGSEPPSELQSTRYWPVRANAPALRRAPPPHAAPPVEGYGSRRKRSNTIEHDRSAATFFFGDARDRLSDFACARRPRRHRHVGFVRVSRAKTLTEIRSIARSH